MTKYVLASHMRKHNGEKYSCDECEYTTHCPKILKSHKTHRHSEEKWKCDFCDYRTHNKHELDDHTMQVHTMERPFKCDQCDYACTNERKLKAHKVGFEDSSLKAAFQFQNLILLRVCLLYTSDAADE